LILQIIELLTMYIRIQHHRNSQSSSLFKVFSKGLILQIIEVIAHQNPTPQKLTIFKFIEAFLIRFDTPDSTPHNTHQNPTPQKLTIFKFIEAFLISFDV
jgi:hypothetical protein